ncbi:MAG: hypothetical protein JWQ62_1372 [Lacunisphaera sp.]|nr:hypothetical protein [Lacunisphaera sp.]
MKKNFSLTNPGQEAARVVEGVKNDVRKYVKRERRKTLPTGVDFWDFDCKVGPDAAAAITLELASVVPAIEAAAQGGGAAVYVEILAKPGHRPGKPADPDLTSGNTLPGPAS